MSLLPFFQWMEAMPMSQAIASSSWLAAVFNLGHLLALVVFVGSVLIVDLRLLGAGVTAQPVARLARDARPWMMGAYLALLITGIPQMTTYAMKQYYSPFFWFKMEVMVVAVIFTLTVRQKITQADEARVGPVWGKLVGFTSIALWTAIAVPARLIGLLS
jgi:hypothetical protein